MRVGDNIRARREAKGLTLTELAQRCNLSKGYLSQIERNEVDRPSAEVLYQIALQLDATVAELLNKPSFTPDPHPVINDGLKEFAAQEGLSEEEVAELAQIRYRGKQPVTAKDWAYVYRTLNMVIGED